MVAKHGGQGRDKFPTAAPSRLRGMISAPSEVKRLVAREASKRIMSDEARQRLLDDFTLQYHFGGCDIAYRRTVEGLEVLAVGSEIGKLFKELPPEAQSGVILGHPEPW
jgi:hypothetical protein